MDWNKLIEFMNIKSITGEEGEAAVWIRNYLKEMGWNAEFQNIEDTRNNVICNLNCRVLFCSHIDVVPPYIPPDEKGESISGRGSSDAKGVVIAQILAAKRLVEQKILKINEIGFAYLVGEEVDHCGAKAVEALDFTSEITIVGEPTLNKLCKYGYGLLKVKFQANGQAGHSAFPGSGKSAVHELVSFLSELDEICGYKEGMGETTYNIGLISGGVAANVFAPDAEATVLFRLAEHSNEIIEKLETLLTNFSGINYEILSRFDPIEFHTEEGFDTTIARFNSDAKYLVDHSQKILLFGPGDIEVAHSSNEFISKDNFLKGIECYVDVVKQMIR